MNVQAYRVELVDGKPELKQVTLQKSEVTGMLINWSYPGIIPVDPLAREDPEEAWQAWREQESRARAGNFGFARGEHGKLTIVLPNEHLGDIEVQGTPEMRRRFAEAAEPSDSNIEFCCPRCGSSYFGTDLGSRVRDCHGENGCRFLWSMDEDWKYFRRVRVWTFATPEEYKRAQGET